LARAVQVSLLFRHPDRGLEATLETPINAIVIIISHGNLKACAVGR